MSLVMGLTKRRSHQHPGARTTVLQTPEASNPSWALPHSPHLARLSLLALVVATVERTFTKSLSQALMFSSVKLT